MISDNRWLPFLCFLSLLIVTSFYYIYRKSKKSNSGGIYLYCLTIQFYCISIRFEELDKKINKGSVSYHLFSLRPFAALLVFESRSFDLAVFADRSNKAALSELVAVRSSLSSLSSILLAKINKSSDSYCIYCFFVSF